jgi:nucleotide-binding universal stress UspA family protein
MFKIRTILHPTDFSSCSRGAFDAACSMARDLGARLVLLHVAQPAEVHALELVNVMPEASPDDWREQLERRLQWLGTDCEGILVERWLEEGDPVREILGVAKEAGADLIVMGTHGRRGLGRFLLGSVAEEVLRRAPCPVLTVKKQRPEARSAPSIPEEEPVAAVAR